MAKLISGAFASDRDLPLGLYAHEAVGVSLERLRALFQRAEDHRSHVGSNDHLVPRRADGAIDGNVTIRSWGIEIRNGHLNGLFWKELFSGISLPLIQRLLAVARDERN